MNIRKKIRDRYNAVEIPQASDVLPAGTASRSKRKGDRGGVKLFIELAASAAVIVFIFGAVLAGQGMLKRQNALPLGDRDTTDTEAYQTTVRNDYNGDTGPEPALTSGRADTEDHGTGAAVETEVDTTTPHVTDPPDETTEVFDTTAAPQTGALGLTGDETAAELNEKLVGKKLNVLEKTFGDVLFSVDGDAANKKLAKKGWSVSSLEGVKLYKIPYDSKTCLNVGVDKSSGKVLWVYPAYSYEDDAYDVLLLRENYRYNEDPVMPLSEFPPTGDFIFDDPDDEVLWGVAGLKEADLTSRWGAPSSSGVWSTVYGTYTVKITFNSKGYAVDLDCEKAANPQRNGVKMPASLDAAVKMTDKKLTSALKNMPGYALTELWGSEGAANLFTPGQAEPTGIAWIYEDKIIVIRMSSKGYLSSASVRNLSDFLYDGVKEYAAPVFSDILAMEDSEIVMPLGHDDNRAWSAEISQRWYEALLAAEYEGIYIPSQRMRPYTLNAGFLPEGSEIVYFGSQNSNAVTYVCCNGNLVMLTFCEKDENGYVFDDDGCVICNGASPVTRYLPIYDGDRRLVGFIYSYTDSYGIRLGVCDLVNFTAREIGTVTVSGKTVTVRNDAGAFTGKSEISGQGGFLIRTAGGFEVLAGSVTHASGSDPTGAKYTVEIASHGMTVTAG